jgi:hypothetical protein
MFRVYPKYFMKNQLSEKQLDKIAKNLLESFSLDIKTLDDLSESPTLFRNIKTQIATEKYKRDRGWFFAFRWQIATFASLVVIFCLIFVGAFFDSKTQTENVAVEANIIEQVVKNVPDKNLVAENSPLILPTAENKIKSSKKSSNTKTKPLTRETNQLKTTPIVLKKSQTKALSQKNLVKEVVETKTDFIALSYSPATDIGQIIRVKVPRALMVSLGVSNNVSKNSELVTAEVIVDNDGSTRAIRFISTNKR